MGGITDPLIVLRGPFTELDMAEIIAAVKAAEARQPDKTFSVAINQADDDVAEVLKRLHRVNPLQPGYKRIVEVFPESP